MALNKKLSLGPEIMSYLLRIGKKCAGSWVMALSAAAANSRWPKIIARRVFIKHRKSVLECRICEQANGARTARTFDIKRPGRMGKAGKQYIKTGSGKRQTWLARFTAAAASVKENEQAPGMYVQHVAIMAASINKTYVISNMRRMRAALFSIIMVK